MTDIETKLKSYEDCGYKLFKLYAEDEDRDPDIPDILDYLDDLYVQLEDECTRLAPRVVAKNADYRDKNKYFDLKRSYDLTDKWLATIPEDMDEYYLVRRYSWYQDLDIHPIKRSELDIVIATAKDGNIELISAGKRLPVYDVTLTDDWEHAYVSLESGRVNGYDTEVDPDTLIVGHPYAYIRQSVLAKSHACKDCGTIFTIPAKEKRFFLSNGLALPKRCRRCRILRKEK